MLSLVLLHAALAADPAAEVQALLTGTFRLAESAAEIPPRLDAATERAIASLFIAFRPLAKYKLRPEVQPCPSWHIALTATHFSNHCGTGEDFQVPVEGSRTVYDDGDPYKATVMVGTRSVKLDIMGEAGGKTTSWKVAADERVSVYTAIVSQHLAEPLAWTTWYVRE